MREIAIGRDWALGDAFMLNGLHHYVAQFYDKVWITSFSRYLDTYKALYENTKINIIVSPESSPNWNQNSWRDMLVSMDIPLVEIDMWEKRPIHIPFYRWYYEQLNIPFEYHKSWFKLPEIKQKSWSLCEHLCDGNAVYKVVHDSTGSKSSYPLVIDDNKMHTVYIRPGITNNLIDFVPLLQNASEIHVTPSSVFWLVKCMEQQLNAKLFFHDIRLTNDPILHEDLDQNKWTILNYIDKI